MQQQSIRLQIVSIVLLSTIFIDVSFVFFHLYEHREQNDSHLRAIICGNNQLLSVVLSEPLYNKNLVQLNFIIDSFLNIPEIVRIDLQEYDGDIQIHQERSPAAKSGEVISQKVIVRHGPSELGEIQIHYTTALIDEHFSASKNHFLNFSLILTASILIIIALLAKRLTNPIAQLCVVSEAMASGDLEQQIAVGGSKELDALGQSFDRMRNVIREKLDALEDNNRLLNQEISERQRIETALEESERKYRALFAGSIEAILVIRGDEVVDCNDAAVKLFGFDSRETLIFKTVADLSSHVQGEGKLTASKLIDIEQETRRAGNGRFEWACKRAGGKEFIGEVSLTTIPMDGEVVFHALVRDITATKQHEEQLLAHQQQLRTLSVKLSLTEEQERRKIAGALHDNLGPILALAKMRLGVTQTCDSAALCKKHLDETISQLTEAINFTRSLTVDISPAVLDSLPFCESLKWLAEHYLEKNSVANEIVVQGQPRPLDDNSRRLLFNVVRELMVNIVKHAKATKAKIVLRWDDDHAHLLISDNGIGFDVKKRQQAALENQSYGLFSIYERLAYLGGSFEIDSAPQQGASAIIKIPIKGDIKEGPE